MIRYKDIQIYYGCNNFKRGKLAYKGGKPILKMNVNGDWFVRYSFWHENKWHPIKERRGLNKYKILEEKISAAENLKIVVIEELEQGYNPITNTFDNTGDPLDKHKQMSVKEAIEHVRPRVEERLRSHVTRSYYKSYSDQWIEAFAAIGFTKQISALRTGHIYEAWEWLKRKYKAAEQTHRNRLAVLQSHLQVLKKLEVFQVNPAHDMDLPKLRGKSEKYAPLSPAEIALVGSYTKANDYRFYVYLKLIFQAAIRPSEILKLRGENILFEHGFIRVESLNSKTHETAYVPVNDELLSDLTRIVGTCPREHYLFSDPDTLHPGAKVLRYPYIRYRWAALRTTLKLPVERKMYALKHTGADHRLALKPEQIPQGLSMEEMLRMILEKLGHQSHQDKLKAVQNLMRHSNVETTKIYLSPHNDEVNESLKNLSPSF